MGDLLDTNVISEINKPRPNPNVLTYFFSRPIEQLFLSDVSVVEIRFGIIRAVDEQKERHLEAWLNDVLYTTFSGRVLPVTQEILLRWRILMDHGRRHNRTYSQPDLFLAATALEHDLTLVTRNTRDFAGIAGIQLLNPWEPTPPDQTP